MRLANETAYRSREIKSLLCATHEYTAGPLREGRLPQWGRVTISVAYTRTRLHSGHAYLNGSRARLRFLNVETGRGHATAREVVRLGYHELMHLYGYRHGQMPRYYPTAEEVRAICERAGFEPGDPLPLYAEHREDEGDDEPTERDRREEELRHALRKRKAWTTRARRAKTALRKWRRKEMRARRQLEDLGADPEAIAADELGGYEPAMAGDLDV